MGRICSALGYNKHGGVKDNTKTNLGKVMCGVDKIHVFLISTNNKIHVVQKPEQWLFLLKRVMNVSGSIKDGKVLTT